MSLDLFNLADTSNKTQVFYSSGTWVKPRGINMVYILTVGAGGGGGGGQTSAGSAIGGGGGGGGGLSRLMVPADLIPDSLNITIGTGGTPGPANTGGGSGSNTIVDSARGDSFAWTFLCIAGGGSAGASGITGGAGGGGGAQGTIANAAVASLGTFFSQVGSSGLAGGNTIPSNATFGTTNIVPFMGGVGGGGKNTGVSNDGASIIGLDFIPTLTGGTSGNINGNVGIFSLTPLFSLGGTGGRGIDAGTGGIGGQGNYGSGGGGGGGGNTGGSGGRGGNGLVVITCW